MREQDAGRASGRRTSRTGLLATIGLAVTASMGGAGLLATGAQAAGTHPVPGPGGVHHGAGRHGHPLDLRPRPGRDRRADGPTP